MKVIVSETTPSQRTLEVTLEQSKVEGAYQKAFGKVARNLALPGFRRGKVPLHLAKKYITDDGLTSHVIEDLVPLAYRDALIQENLQPISEPRWEVVQRERGKDMIFKVSFEIKPVLEIADYKGIEIQHAKEDVADTHVEATLDELRGQHAKLAPAPEDHTLQEGDIALVDYRSDIDGVPVEGGSAEKYLMEVKHENFIPGFVNNLLGLKAGDNKEFEIDFPAEYANPDLASKHVHFNFHLYEIKQRELPAADDEFAQAVSPLKTIDELRTELRTRLEANLERRVREQVALKIIDKLLPQISPDHVPPTLHNWRTRVELQRRLQDFARMGVTLERYLTDRKITQEQWMMELSVLGQLESRVEILVESLARKEGIRVTDQEVEQILQAEAQHRGVSATQLRRQIDEENTMGLIRYSMLRAKVMDMLFEQAKIEYVEPGAEPAREPAPKAPKKAKAAKAEAAPATEEAAPAEAPAKKTSKKAEAAEKKPVEGEAEATEPKAKAKRTSKKKEG